MIKAKLQYNTKNIYHNKKCYCAYCGKEIPEDVECHPYSPVYFYHCDCEDAMKEIGIYNKIAKKQEEIQELQRSIPKAKYQLTIIETEVLAKISRNETL